MSEFATLEDLGVGVVNTFLPTDSELVCHYLHQKITNNYSPFPEIPIYGNNGLPPWEIWTQYQEFKYPHQDFLYFFTRAEKLSSKGLRKSRRIGCNGQLGTWSESGLDSKLPISVNGVKAALRKYRYESKKDKKDKKETDVTEGQHGAWLMDEFTIDQAPDLALCRIKANERGGDRSKSSKRKNIESHANVGMKQPLKKHRLDQEASSTSQQISLHDQEASTSQPISSPSFHQHTAHEACTSQTIPSPSVHEHTAQVANNSYADYLEELLTSDDYENVPISPTANNEWLQLLEDSDLDFRGLLELAND